MTFIIGSSLASVAGVMFVMYYGVIDFYIGFLAGIKAFTAAVLGGIGSIPGAMLGGLLIGLIEKRLITKRRMSHLLLATILFPFS